jgi:hypothetical protein
LLDNRNALFYTFLLQFGIKTHTRQTQIDFKIFIIGK